MARGRVVLDCRELARTELATIDQMARLCLEARHAGCEPRLSNPTACLIEISGLAEVLQVEPGRKSEQREDPRRVEEEGELPDLSV